MPNPVLPTSPRSASPRSVQSPRSPQSPRSAQSPGSVCSSQKSHGNKEVAQQKVVQRVARYMSTMQVSDPELLRATSPSSVLSGFGRALQDGPFEAYHLSRATTRISAFWSHSWHGQPWQKTLVLLFTYNGFPAVVLGSWATLLLLALTCWNDLPGIQKEATLEPGTVYTFSMWGLGSGVLVAGLALLFWQPRGSIFLDRVCIHQTDEKLKAQAILSIGAFLKNSDTMLVLWDPSYVERLWCVFELAAFLQSHEQSVNRLAIRPTCMGPIALAGSISYMLINVMQISVPFSDRMTGNLVYWLVIMVLFTLAGQVLRSYYRSVETMKKQLAKFRFEERPSPTAAPCAILMSSRDSRCCVIGKSFVIAFAGGSARWRVSRAACKPKFQRPWARGWAGSRCLFTGCWGSASPISGGELSSLWRAFGRASFISRLRWASTRSLGSSVQCLARVELAPSQW
ncbi:unnamed protein product [Effrenium voratum]|nr:unnamed protein product [Effrenium voratum]